MSCRNSKIDILVFTAIIIFILSWKLPSGFSNEQQGQEDFYSYFLREAYLHEGDYKSSFSIMDIPWADIGEIERAAEFSRRNMVSLTIVNLYTLIESFSSRSTVSVAITTGEFHNSSIAYDRLLSTLFYVQNMCQGGIQMFNPNTTSYASVKKVRRKHISAASVSTNRSLPDIDEKHQFRLTKDKSDLAEAIRRDLSHVDTSEAPMHLFTWDKTTPVGQYDLGVLQFLFFVHVAQSPHSFGIYTPFPNSFEDIDAYVHLWAIVGRVLGIQDRFNVALNLPPHMYQTFYTDIVLASFKNLDEKLIGIMMNGMEGVSRNFLVPSMAKLNCFLYRFFTDFVPGFNGANLLRLMDLEDRVCVRLLDLLTAPLNNIIQPISFLTKLTFESWYRDEVEKMMSKIK